MTDKIIGWLIRKLVNLLYKRTQFMAYSWGIDDITDINILSEESTFEYHRFGTRIETYGEEVEE